MGEDITVVNALFQIVQRIEDKVDVLKDDMSSVKSKQAVIETSLHDHIDSTTKPEKSGMDAAKGFILKYMLPIAIAILMLGRASVGFIGNGGTQYQTKAPQSNSKVVNDDTFVARNERFDSLLRVQLKKTAGIGGD